MDRTEATKTERNRNKERKEKGLHSSLSLKNTMNTVSPDHVLEILKKTYVCRIFYINYRSTAVSGLYVRVTLA